MQSRNAARQGGFVVDDANALALLRSGGGWFALREALCREASGLLWVSRCFLPLLCLLPDCGCPVASALLPTIAPRPECRVARARSEASPGISARTAFGSFRTRALRLRGLLATCYQPAQSKHSERSQLTSQQEDQVMTITYI